MECFLGPCFLKLHRLELFLHDVHLRNADDENVAFHVSRARHLSVDLKEHTVCGVNKTDATAMHFGVRHGAKVDKQPKLLVCVKPYKVHFAGNFLG